MSDPIRCRTCAKSVRLRADGTVGVHDSKSGQQCRGTGWPPAGDQPCLPTCVPVGTIGWPARLTAGEPHASTVVCDSLSHQEQAHAWVYELTGHAGVFRTFAEARAGG